MTECQEVAAGLADKYRTELAKDGQVSTMDAARALVSIEMPGESLNIIDNVAWSLHNSHVATEQRLRTAKWRVHELVLELEAQGIIVTVERETLTPLAMRNTAPRVEVRLKR